MTGGRYHYLYRQEPDELLGRSDDLTAIRDRLSELGAADVATEVDEIIAAINSYRTQVERRMDKVANVLRAVESLDSGDGGEDDVAEAVTRYRAHVD
ncbi:hypothetical protein [Nocardia brevicatena]|uniref:hypothetical protein n=1 Tax=Nocardia brevicatena TaxID=37327 RepID=UPI00030427EE|nr:hypothetical protein [Nocardia brevicatena]